jgi:pSer/pThr/pTyr-binding forkhead associated (FHA) protein
VKLRLVCQDALAFPREISLDSFPLELGRGETVAVRIDDRWLSRRHCSLEQDASGQIVVRDLGSRHGTYINGQRISESKLLPGDELSIGLTHFRAEFETDSAAVVVSGERRSPLPLGEG